MSVWFCIPSARPAAEANVVLEKWRALGYRIALWLDADDKEMPICDLVLVGPYPGYSLAVNALVKEVLRADPQCEWIVTGGDDIEPDPKLAAAEIARQCTEHFAGTFGVMQPTGDRWADGSIDRICGSPWIGRDFCRRIYGGNGPLWSEFFHMFEDEHLQHVAIKLGCLWQRRDLVHLHRHWMRDGEGVGSEKKAPEFLERANSAENWRTARQEFDRLKAGGFAETDDLLPVETAAGGY